MSSELDDAITRGVCAGRWDVAWLAIGSFAMAGDLLVVAAILPEIAADFGVTVASASALIAVHAVAVALAAPAAAFVLRTLTLRVSLIVAIAVFVAGNILVVVVSGLEVALIGRALSGAATALYMVATYRFIAVFSTPQSRPKSLSLLQTGVAFATVSAAPVGAWMAHISDWRIAIAITTVPAFVAFAALRNPAVTGILSPGPGQRKALVRAPVPAILISSFLARFVYYSCYAFVASIYGGVGPQRLPVVLAALGTASVLGNWVAALLMRRWSPFTVGVVGLTGLACTVGVLPFVGGSLAGAMVSATCWGLFGWMIGLAQIEALFSTGDADPSFLGGVSYTVTALGTAAGGLIAGMCFAASGVRGLSLMAAAASLAGAVILGTASSRKGYRR
ncbi:MFS transporter [Rhodococcus erythropolis]|uniref:MFS transporter n=1 Tax=Rhodococcus erythropolis TaxID=1833 RepID=UPI001BE54EBE|nr:MFS transporter [Rhodococcus erythropolis]MBT2269021.1 MFS transporter [Rhodococcus erythropolis]